MGGRRKNPHPKRAENARTVLKGDVEKREERGDEEDEEPKVSLCLRIPDDDDVVGDYVEQNEIRKEKRLFRRRREGREREGNTSAMFARRCLDIHPSWSNTCVLTRTRNRTNVKCARSVLVMLVI